jgi:HTH-type transcriptional regulator/antitoxin HipB
MNRRFQALMTAPQLGQLLLSARTARKMSQAVLASSVGLSQSRVSHLEQHANEISVEQLMAWCAALELEISIGPRGLHTEPNPEAAW